MDADTDTAPARVPVVGAPVGLGPAWFVTVMGTGIVAVALAGLPLAAPGVLTVATGLWALAALLLLMLVAATVREHLLVPGVVRARLDDPATAPFHGAPAMALMTVGAGAVLVGVPGALAIDAVLWSAGTLLGLVTTVLVPLRLRRAGVRTVDAVPVWLMPVVPPMVSAATGPLLVAGLSGTARAALLVVCWACFVVSLVASVVVGALVVRRLARAPLPPAAVPSLFVVLGPLGQSVTAVHHLAAVGPGDALTLAYGAPVWLLALVWTSYAVGRVARTARAGDLRFGLPWWSFTFPLGTLVTGTAALADTTGLAALDLAAAALTIVLLTAWVVVATRTVRWVVR